VSYADYLATVRVQSQRDRDRFLGIESHEDQPMYSAETGDRVLDVATLRSYAAFEQAMANFGGVVTRAYEGYRDLLSPLLAAFAEAEDQLIHGTGDEPFGILPSARTTRTRISKPRRHSYPQA